ncbi:prepilin-type N-terminal cleavage/methylation domain-containing protein [Thalassotalea euphylliae]|uniref:Prepilin-type N-terminal cleavage/methylation domain-containing protein n=1 Tax=Thalassotalea euphylliae TaxID=1655234 RepID=A0A3E0TZW5_9GAMM|nr:prepilin-type N-terminal cleavage/methylation domain-containing protein [Thalassotalea euphylliae]REL30231.1 prepilin-type N-terminal cleavage/methylation domain-containing protein [Thalassotalea euphylliae]
MVKSKGFSLVELLVALTIMSFTLIIMTQGYTFFIERWGKELGNFDDSAKTMKSLLLTRRLVESIYPFIVRAEKNEPVIFFEGDNQGLVAITTKSLYSQELPTIFRLSLKQQEDLSYALIYEEQPANNAQAFTHMSQRRKFSKTTVLLEKLEFLEFSYFGHENIDEKNSARPMRWWTSFNALNRRVMPQRLNIKFGLLGAEQNLQVKLTEIDSRVLVQFSESF